MNWSRARTRALGQRIRESRRRAGLTQVDVVQRLAASGHACTQAELSKIERGYASRWHLADIAYLTAIAVILSVDVDCLVHGDE